MDNEYGSSWSGGGNQGKGSKVYERGEELKPVKSG